jgi:hypothetical protein
MPLIELADVFDSGIDYSRAALGGAVFYSEQAAENPSDYKVLRGRNIGKFWLEFDGIWLRNNWRDIQQEHIAIDSKVASKSTRRLMSYLPRFLSDKQAIRSSPPWIPTVLSSKVPSLHHPQGRGIRIFPLRYSEPPQDD